MCRAVPCRGREGGREWEAREKAVGKADAAMTDVWPKAAARGGEAATATECEQGRRRGVDQRRV